MAPLSVLIVGAGVSGPTIASFLLLSPQPAYDRPHITILERSSAPRANGQNIDIRGGGVTVIRKLGLESAVRAHLTEEEGVSILKDGEPVISENSADLPMLHEQMHIVDTNNRVVAEFPADKTGKIQTSTSDLEILRGRLGEILCRRLEDIARERENDVEYIYGDQLDQLEQDDDKVHVRFARSGERRSFDVVVGADGLQSKTRKMAFGVVDDDLRLKKWGLFAAFFSMPSADTDDGWCRWYHQTGRRAALIRPSENKSRSTVLMSLITETDDRFEDALLHRDVDTQRALFKEYYRGGGWECDRIIREIDRAEDFYCDMFAQVRMEKWSRGRVVLLGDAGYCGSPISGLGTTFGLTGAYNLAGCLMRHQGDHSAAFADYEAIMRPFVERGQKLAPGAPRSAFAETAWGLWVFHTILWLISISGIGNLFQAFIGPSADEDHVVDYGFEKLEEWTGWEKVLVSR